MGSSADLRKVGLPKFFYLPAATRFHSSPDGVCWLGPLIPKLPTKPASPQSPEYHRDFGSDRLGIFTKYPL